MSSFHSLPQLINVKKEPTRFLGEGVSFKAKLIGILEVSEARGDRMCQAALADLKMAIRAAGEHKQRIAVQVSIDGLRLRDEKTGECLYHHPVHKISFIAQDMHDSRAFGYIFGSPDTGHRFFGIKTDKAANQVVIAMRDLFQVVFELKKKEIELAKQHIDQNSMKLYPSGIVVEPQPDTKGAAGAESCCVRRTRLPGDIEKAIDKKQENRSGIMADLLDLQFELHSLQQGIHQMDKITPENRRATSEDPFETDPFGDSFTNMKVKGSVQPILPPPPSSAKRSHLERQQTVPTPSSSTSSPATVLPSKSPPPTSVHWLENEEKRFSDGEVSSITGNDSNDRENKVENDLSASMRAHRKSPQVDVFTELDPLGTGLSKPYIDKKDFFQHLKNPPKKVLKDLVTTSGGDTFPTNFDLSIDSLDPVKIQDKSVDIFEDEEFANFDKFEDAEAYSTPKSQSPQLSKKSRLMHHQPLSVCLPPEEIVTHKNSGKFEREISEPVVTLIHLPSPKKYQSGRKKDFDIDLPTSYRNQSVEKSFPVDFTCPTESPASPMRSGSSDANSRLSSSSAELDIVPEPPPRGAGSILINPPPLPPKKQSGRINKPPPRPPHNDSHFHYDFIGREEMTPSPTRKDRTIKSPDVEHKDKFDDNFSPSSPRLQIKQTDCSSSSRFEDSFNNMAPSTTLSSLFRNSYLGNVESKKKPTLDITLSQLTSSNLVELAASLDMTVTELTSLTLQQLADCLAKFSAKEMRSESYEKVKPETSKPLSKETSFVSHEPMFKANFKEEKKVDDEPSYDKYAVFRELLEMEQFKTVNSKSVCEEEVNDHRESSSQEEEINDNENKIELNIKIDCECELKPSSSVENVLSNLLSDEALKELSKTISEEALELPKKMEKSSSESDIKSNEEIEVTISSPVNCQVEKTNFNIKPNVLITNENNTDEIPKESETKSQSTTPSDRYAALREIVEQVFPMTEECEEKDNKKSPSPIKEEKHRSDQDLMKLFSAPPSQQSSPKKLEKQDEDLREVAADIFDEIRMLNSNINNSNPSTTSACVFEDVFSPFTETKQKRNETKDDGNWAKFETNIFHSDKNSYESHGSLGGTSPWSPDEKEYQKEQTFNTSIHRHSGESDNEWKDEEESEESNGRHKDETFWPQHPRFDSNSEESNIYDDSTSKDRNFCERSMRKSRGIPWTKEGGHRPRTDPPPWHEEGRWEEEHRRYPPRKVPYKDDEERKAHWKCRTSSRPPWNGDRDSFRAYEQQLYEEDRKRRMMLWNKEERDRFSSQESMGYDDEERWSRREYERRRWEEDGRFWGRRPEGDYPIYRKHNIHYCRDSRERPIDYPPGWGEEYGPEREENSPRYVTRKRQWPKRPNSANEDRNAEIVYAEPRIKYGVSRSECSDNDSELYHRPYRSRSRESYWESDQEFENWGDRLYWSEGPDSKTESLHRRRMSRKLGTRPKAQSSPFEDDFTESIENPTEECSVVENRIQSDVEVKQSPNPRIVQENMRTDPRKYKRSNYFADDIKLNTLSDVSETQHLSSGTKTMPEKLPCDHKDPISADNFVSEESCCKDSFSNGNKRSDDDAFAFKSELDDNVPNTTATLPMKNSRQIKYGNNKIKDHDIKKSESVNIFVRESDPFDDDDFFN